MAKHKITKKTVLKIIGVIVLLLAMVGAGVFAWWWKNKDNVTDQGGLGGYSAADEETLPEAASDAQNLALSGKADEAQQKISDALAQTTSTDTKERQQLYVQQGVIYENNGDYQDALQSYLAADAIISDFTTTHLIGETYEALGDSTNAIKYYKLAIAALDTTSPGYESDKAFYENKVKALGGQL